MGSLLQSHTSQHSQAGASHHLKRLDAIVADWACHFTPTTRYRADMGLIRVLLAWAVVATHSRVLFGLGFTGLVYGTNAVQMFYTISGFYMALILNRKYTGSGSYQTFIKSRIYRIYPAYAVVAIATCALGALVYVSSGKLIFFFRNWSELGPGASLGTRAILFILNVVLLGQDSSRFFWVPSESGALAFTGSHSQQPMCQEFMVVPQAWTVGTELWFYLLAPFVVRRLTRIVPVLAAALALRLIMIHLLGLVDPPWNYCFFPTELPIFLSGALGFHAYVALERRRFPLEKVGRIAFFGMIFLIVGYYNFPWKWFPNTKLVLNAEPIVFIFPFALPFIFAHTRKNTVDRMIGDLSYPIYLTHFIIIDLLRVTESPWVDRYMGEFACLCTIAASVILWYFVDRPIDAWRQSLVGSVRRPRPEVAPSWSLPRQQEN
jgi:peptidoglycan/LPS O-acetylase OafA/YrhL